MRFADIFNHEVTKKHLKELVQENRLSHALFFLGKEGTGGLALARALAQYIVCEKTEPAFREEAGPSLFGDEVPVNFPEDSCGTCAACIKASQMIHPDIHYTFPVIPTGKPHSTPVSSDYITAFRKWAIAHPYSNSYNWLQSIDAENKQGNITAKECEIILHNMNLKSFESTYKIQIIWMPEALGAMGNKLLKIIEEPPVNTLFILVAENEEQVLSTILSRALLIKIPTPDKEAITRALIDREGAGESLAKQIAGICNGNYNEALQLLQHPESDWEELVKDWMNSIVKYNTSAQAKFIEQFAKLGREKQKQFLRFYMQILQHTVHVLVLGEEIVAQRESTGVHTIATKLSRLMHTEQIDVFTHELDDAIYHIERNANPKILVHALTIRLVHIIYNKSLILVK
jgi:DNA polymerase-3 subunit delta'